MTLTKSSQSDASGSADLVMRGVRLHQGGKVGEAAELYLEALRLEPDNPEANHLLGMARLAQQRIADALPLLNRAIELVPDNPQYLANLGVALNAAESYERAVAVLDRAIALRPEFPGAYSNRGMAFRGLGMFDEAVSSYEAAIRLKPEEAGFHFNLANALTDAARPHEALQAMERALALRPDHPGTVAGRIELLQTLRRYEEALLAAEDAAMLAPESIPVLSSLAAILAQRGQVDRSVVVLRRILELDPSDGFAARFLSLSRRHEVGDADIERLHRAFSDHTMPRRKRIRVGFGYGKALADIGDHAASRDVFVEANAMRRLDQPYSLSRALQVINRISEQFETVSPREAHETDPARPSPIFVVGLPRAGKTTIETLLAGSKEAWAAGELGRLKRAVTIVLPENLRRERDPLARFELLHLKAAALRDAGESYLRYVSALAPPAATVIDTMPANFMLVGFIQLMLPGARVVHAVRDPQQQAVALFEKCFNHPEYGYTCNLEELQAYHRAYRNMMRQWDRQFPGAVFRADVEELRQSPEAVQKLLRFCRLDSSPMAAIAESEPEIDGLSLEARALDRRRHADAYAADLKAMAAETATEAGSVQAGNPSFTYLNRR